jgi:Zn-finger nucleic acid-binding protein
MKCPRCGTVLDARTHAGITAAICPQCGGGWLSTADLERAIRAVASEQGVVLRTLALLEGASHPTTLTCPQCAATLLEQLTLRGVEVERCSACRGVFLDPGEGRALAQRVIMGSAAWDQSYQALLRTIQRWATPAPEPWLLDPGDFTSSGQGPVE